MYQVISAIVSFVLLWFVMMPSLYFSSNAFKKQEVKRNLNLAARALCTSIVLKGDSLKSLSSGYVYGEDSGVGVDLGKLLESFYALLARNCKSPEEYEDIKARICAKVLVEKDRFYIADALDRWSFPFFFCIVDERLGPVYLTIDSDSAYYFGEDGEKITTTLGSLGISREERDAAVIDMINDRVARFTFGAGAGKGLEINIRNPYRTAPEYVAEKAGFNILEGTTFFVVYAADKLLGINGQLFKYKNYGVAGYTLSKGPA